ncbi:MAG: DPP IV N-terminal domain-containing protein, partial [Planctomycetaceae bacterium]|nr:DPP IV N-terminal domain-containing protein [Planctomycetaceae bacterium]
MSVCRSVLVTLTMLLLIGVSSQTVSAQNPRGYLLTIQPHWNEAGDQFWYQNDLPDRKRRYVLVDASQGKRIVLLDSDQYTRLLKSLPETVQQKYDRLPSDAVYDFASAKLLLKLGEAIYGYVPGADQLNKLGDQDVPQQFASGRVADDAYSDYQGESTEIEIVNESGVKLDLFWIDAQRRSQGYGSVEAGQSRSQHTYAGHVWELLGPDRQYYGRYRGSADRLVIRITEPVERERSRPEPRPRKETRSGPGAFLQAGNIFHRENPPRQLTTDGTAEHPYHSLFWSPDEETVIAAKTWPVEIQPVHLVESSPEKGGRAVLHSHDYVLPGDPLPRFDFYRIDLASGAAEALALPEIDFGDPRGFWLDENTFCIEKIDRGHPRYRLLAYDRNSNEIHSLIDESTETFLWTTHGPNIPLLTRLKNTAELIYASEQSGTRQLYLVQPQAESVLTPITSGSFVVREIVKIDEEARELIFAASGQNPGEDPYHLHYYRIRFDGSELTSLTAGNGTHSVQFSPDGSYLIDTWSRVDFPPQHVLRDARTGKQICELEQADVSQLTAAGQMPPRIFSAPGRDGTTEIWGFVCFPKDYDPEKSYPVIEDIYAGPHGAHVPKNYRSAPWYPEETAAGFFVVKIDGMGTAHRSKAFHDVCWHN